MERAHWLEERRKGLGGSDSPVVLGVSPFKTQQDLWAEKRGLVLDVEPTPAMKRGTVLEPLVADMYSEATGRKVRRVNQILQHKEYDFMLANIDREIVGAGLPGVLEIKCPGLKVFSECKRQGVPDYYQIQLQHYMAVTGRQWGALAVFNAERWELVFFDVKRDEEIINMIVVKDAEFWQMVLNNEIPALTDTPIIDLPPVGGGELVTLDTPEWKTAIMKLNQAQELRKEVDEFEKEAKEEIQAIMTANEARVIEGADARIYWKPQPGRVTIDGKRLQKDMPEIWQKYSKQGREFMTFRPYFLRGGMANE